MIERKKKKLIKVFSSFYKKIYSSFYAIEFYYLIKFMLYYFLLA